MIDAIQQWIVRIILIGQVTFYNPGIFENVAKNRNLPECKECIGYIALMEPETIGRKAWLYDTTTKRMVGPLLIVDCAAEQHKAMLKSKKWVADIDPLTWHKVLQWPDKPMQAVILVDKE